MRNVASLFNEETLNALKEELDICLTDNHDYSQEELDDIFMKIEDDFPYEYDKDGMPLRLGRIFEDLIDTFQHNNLVKFSK